MDDENFLPEHYLNLAGIELGEALTQMNNLRQRRASKTDYREVQIKLHRAMAALAGHAYTAPVDPIHIGQ